MNTLPTPRPLLVVVLDGWGISFVEKGNAIEAAETPAMDDFALHYPTAALRAASIEVGLPWGEVGNSEVGHSNIGAGQVRYQILPMIDKAIADKSFFSNRVLTEAVKHAQDNNSSLHLMGLASTGGVHSHVNHLLALLKMAAEMGLKERVYLHLFTDGRDTPPQNALTTLPLIEDAIGRYGTGRIASVTGRFYAMDRNENWSRTQQTYEMLTGAARAAGAASARQAIEQSYGQQIFDEMIPPTAITHGGSPIAAIGNNDAVLFFNYRPDRARQLTRAFVEPDFIGFSRTLPANIYFATMGQYDPRLPAPAAFIEEPVPQPLARVISDAGLKQLHIAETEKYAHVTYYLNGGYEQPFPNEEHVMIQSSSVKNFSDQPQMGAREITDRVAAEIARGEYDVYFINYANADMVGHTGNFEATKVACGIVDECLGRLRDNVLPVGGAILVTADHGNAEEKIHPLTGAVETDHTSNPVPIHFIREELKRTSPRSLEELTALYSSPIGVLADVAPTVLDVLHLKQPPAMTGISLLSSLQ